MFFLLFQYAARSFKRFFVKNRAAKIITVFGFFVVFAFLVTVVYFGFRAGFQYIGKDLFFGDALFLYIVELFLLVSFILVVASALISGMFALFQGGDSPPLLASPRYQWKPVLVFLRMFLSSLWPLLAIILPALFAIGNVYGLPLAGFILSIISVVLVIALGVMWAMATLFIIAWVLYFLGRRSARFLTFRNFTEVVALSFLLQLFLVWGRVTTVDLVKFFQARVLDVATPDLSPFLEQFSVLPTHFSAMTIYLSRTGDLGTAFSYPLYFVPVVLSGALALYLLGKHHLILWELFQEHAAPIVGRAFSVSRLGSFLLRCSRGSSGAIVGKETIAFMRNSRGLLWLGFILLIWFLQLGASRILSHGLGTERVSGDMIPSFVGTFQFAVIIYFVSMFVLRFAFPSFSSERKTSWIVGSAPVSLGVVFISKLRFFTLLFSALTVAFALLSVFVAGFSSFLAFLFVLVIVLATFVLTTYGLSLGAIFPNFESDDPEVLSTTLPGLGFIFGALGYGAFGAYALGLLWRGGSFVPLALFVTLSFLAVFVLVRLAQQSLSRAEF
ncbi:MAG TPA: hypothetical protein VJJ02_00410 [Candidatus Paceibacterota bacterium]